MSPCTTFYVSFISLSNNVSIQEKFNYLLLKSFYYFIYFLFLNLLFNSQVTHAIFVESIYGLLVSSLGSTNIAFGGKPDLEKVVLKTPIHLAVHPMFHFLVDQLNVVSLLLMVAR